MCDPKQRYSIAFPPKKVLLVISVKYELMTEAAELLKDKLHHHLRRTGEVITRNCQFLLVCSNMYVCCSAILYRFLLGSRRNIQFHGLQ